MKKFAEINTNYKEEVVKRDLSNLTNKITKKEIFDNVCNRILNLAKSN